VRADREFSPEITIGEMVGGENDDEGKKTESEGERARSEFSCGL
jgi:hypothetical protein